MRTAPSAEWPAWLRDLYGSIVVHPQVVLTGNIRDVYLLPGEEGPRLAPLLDCVWEILEAGGTEWLLLWDPVDGCRVFPETSETIGAASSLLGLEFTKGAAAASLARFEDALKVVVGTRSARVGAVVDYASRIVPDPASPGPEEHRFFVFCQKMSHTAQPQFVEGPRPGPLYNPIVWVADSERDLPAWFTAANEAMRVVPVPHPDLGQRQTTAQLLAEEFVDYAEEGPESQRALTDAFASLTEGMSLSNMIETTRLARDQDVRFHDISDAVRASKVGILDNPWKREYLRDRITSGENLIRGRVVGQDQAITRALDILKRSVTGLSGAQTSAVGGRPRGVLFFAGPTGVGKTEVAKSLSEVIFGNERAYLRFDMSEFSAEHADARLIGAPPGYIGHDAGGELTNALRQRPFSLVLFDEIEKAHPRILDKFLQVLEDGRLTDGHGATVHFSEALIVFTSNIGTVVEDGATGVRIANVDASMPYEEVANRIRSAIEHHFIVALNRPELLNRLGDNIVVFDFIHEDAAETIFDLLVGNITARVLREHGADLEMKPDVRSELLALATADLRNGGRGIGAVLESVLVNSLARALFVRDDDLGGTTITITGLKRERGVYEVELA